MDSFSPLPHLPNNPKLNESVPSSGINPAKNTESPAAIQKANQQMLEPINHSSEFPSLENVKINNIIKDALTGTKNLTFSNLDVKLAVLKVLKSKLQL